MDLNVTRDFLNLLYGDLLEDAFFNVFTLGNRQKTGKWLPTDEKGIEYALRFAREYKDQDLYFGVSLSNSPHADHERLINSNKGKRLPSGLVGVWADIDCIKSDNKKPYPTNVEKAKALAYATGVEPTMIVDTGGGIHAYWLFKEVWSFDSEDEVNEARILAEKWQKTILKKARENGFVIDMVFDLERVLRLPGSENHKHGKPLPVRLLEVYPSRRYNPSELNEFIDDDLTNIVEVKHADNFIFNPQASPNFTKLEALRENFDEFNKLLRGGWRKKFDSQSEVDFSFINWLTRMQWTDQEIVDFLVWFRREIAGEDVKRPDYYAYSIGKVRSEKKQEEAAIQLSKISDTVEEIKQSADSPEAAADAVKETVFQNVSQIFGFEVTRIIKYLSEPPTYAMETSKGRIDFGTSTNLLSPAKFQEKLLDGIGIAVILKRSELATIITSLMQAVDVVDLGIEATNGGSLRVLLVDYLEKRKIYEGDEFKDGIFNAQPAQKDDWIYISLNDFCKFLRFDHFETPVKSEIAKQFALMSVQPKVVKVKSPQTGRNTTRNTYILPVTILD